MSKRHIFFFTIWMISLISIQSQLLAIDFGTQFIKASVVHSGAGKSFSIVQNSKSERKMLSALGFYSEERFYQNDALPKRTRFPENCFLFSRMLIDFHRNPSLIEVIKKDLFLQYINQKNEDQLLAEFVLKNFPEETNELTLLQVMTMILKYVKTQGQKFAKVSIKDVVLILPNYWSIHQRNFILAAAQVADIYVLSIISQNTAASINYALSQRTQNKTENVLFYNLGSNALQMTLVQYRQVPTEKSKAVESIFILDDFGLPYVGGLRLDTIICKYFAEIFQQKYKKKLDRKGLIKLLDQSNQVKETLTANKQATVFVEGIMDGIDFNAKITRQQFENRAQSIFKQLTQPLKRFLLDNNLKADDLHAVELIGGGARIPKIQSLIAQILNNQKDKIGTHINGDESMALGGAFFAANSSKKFKVKGMNLYDGFNFEIRLILRNLNSDIKENDQEYIYKNATIFKKKSRYGLNKQVNFKCGQNLIVDLYTVDSEGNQQLIKSYELDQIQSVNETDFKVSLVFSIDPLEVVVLKDSKFTYKKDEITSYLQKVKKPKVKNETEQVQNQKQQKQQQQQQQKQAEQQEQTEQSAKTEEVEETKQNQQQEQQKSQSSDQKQNKTSKGKRSKRPKKQQVQYQTVSKNKTVTKKYEKQLRSRQSFNIKKDEQSLGERTRQMLKKYQQAQQKKRLLAQSKNKLQALIYEAKDKVQNQQFIKFSKKSQRQQLQQLSKLKQEWQEQTNSKNPNDYREHYSQLFKPLDRIKRRMIEHSQREHLRDRALDVLKQYKNLTSTIKKQKSWLTDQQVEQLMTSIDDSIKKVRQIYKQMQQTKVSDDSPYKNKDMIKQGQTIKDKYFALKAKIKPKKQKQQEKKSQKSEKSQEQSVGQDEL